MALMARRMKYEEVNGKKNTVGHIVPQVGGYGNVVL